MVLLNYRVRSFDDGSSANLSRFSADRAGFIRLPLDEVHKDNRCDIVIDLTK